MRDVPYQIFLKESVRKDTRRIPSVILDRILQRISILAKDPHPSESKKLRGEDTLYRIRVGLYRILYHIDTEAHIITIVRIGHRGRVYRDV